MLVNLASIRHWARCKEPWKTKDELAPICLRATYPTSYPKKAIKQRSPRKVRLHPDESGRSRYAGLISYLEIFWVNLNVQIAEARWRSG